MLDRAYNIGAQQAYKDVLTKLAGREGVEDRYGSDTEASEETPHADKSDGAYITGFLGKLNTYQVGETEEDSDRNKKRKKRENGPAINKKEQWSNKVQLNGYGY